MSGPGLRKIRGVLRSGTLPIDRTAMMYLLAMLIFPVQAIAAQNAKTPSKPQPLQGNETVGVGRNPKNMTGGMIFGGDWMVTFKGMPADWTADSGLANQIGVQEVFHPQHWNPQQLTPSVIFSFSHKEPGDETVAENMANDEQRANAQNPRGKILPAPALAINARQKAPVRIYEYPHGWDMVVYSEEGNLLYVTTLHCSNSAQCAPFKSFFAKFARSIDYTGNVTVQDETKHH